TVTWDETLTEFPASASWVLSYSFTGPTSVFASSHVPIGADHRIAIDTSAIEAGHFDYAKKITDGSETFTLERGFIDVDPDLSGDSVGVDRRSFAAITLENIEALLKGKATKDQSSYSLNGRALSRYSIDELNDWRAKLRVEVRDERQKARRLAGGKSHTNVRARFSSGVP
ncbi:hypothetical protein LCGC14_2076500, partial [marine sediment metagenome]